MAVTLKADTEDFPGILSLLGISTPPINGDAGVQPPLAPPEADSTPDASPAPSAGPTKLLRLQQALGAAAPDLSAAPGPSAPPADIAGTAGADAAKIKPTGFKQEHPLLSSILKNALEFVQNAGPGVGARTFGEGFQTAAAQPGIRANQAAQQALTQAQVRDIPLERAGKQAQVAKTQAEVKKLGEPEKAKLLTDQGIPYAIERGNEQFVIGDPNMPPELQPMATAAVKAHQQRVKEAADVAANKPDTGAQMDKEYQDIVAVQKAGGKLTKAQQATRDAYEYRKTIGPRTQVILNNAAGGGLSDPATDKAAQRYHDTGLLPPGNRGTAGIAQNRRIMNREAEMFPDQSLTAGSAEYKANAESLKKLQGNLDAVTAFEQTANKNLDLLLAQGKKVIDSGSPWVNKPLRSISQSALGDIDVPAFNAARQVAINEIAKVTSSPGLTGQLSDTARREVEAFIPGDATFEQTYHVAEVLKQDMTNRHQSYQEQIDRIKGRIGNSAQTAPAKTSAETRTYLGATYEKQSDGSWKKQTAVH